MANAEGDPKSEGPRRAKTAVRKPKTALGRVRYSDYYFIFESFRKPRRFFKASKHPLYLNNFAIVILPSLPFSALFASLRLSQLEGRSTFNHSASMILPFCPIFLSRIFLSVQFWLRPAALSLCVSAVKSVSHHFYLESVPCIPFSCHQFSCLILLSQIFLSVSLGCGSAAPWCGRASDLGFQPSALSSCITIAALVYFA